MPRLGEVLADRYRIDGALGVGGMATVHRARDLRLGRDVAVKVLLPNLALDATLVERFVREAHALAAVNHPAVVAVYDVDPGDQASGREPFYVMELCDGGSLADRIRNDGALAPDVAIPVLAVVADGLAELHRRGIVHRDVKPHNILIVGGRAKIGDFGIASFDAPDATSRTAEGTTLGTLAYLAPECLAGRPATPAADVYELAGSTCEALTGRRPRSAASVADIVEHRADRPPRVSALRPALGPFFDGVVAAGLDPEPSLRPDASTFGRQLGASLGAWRAGMVGAGPHPMTSPMGAATAPTEPPGPLPAWVEPMSSTAAPPAARGSHILRPPRPLRRAPITEPSIAVVRPASASAGGDPSPSPPHRAPWVVPAATRRSTPPGPGTRPPASSARTPAGTIGIGLVAGGIVMVALLLVAASFASWIDERSALATGSGRLPGIAGVGGSGAAPSARAIPPATPRPTPRPAATPVPRPSPSPSPSPAVTPGVSTAIGDMRAAIDGAQGSGGLTGREARDLGTQLAAVETAAADGDRAGAIAGSGRLTSDVIGLVVTGRVGGDVGDRLFRSALALGAAVATA